MTDRLNPNDQLPVFRPPNGQMLQSTAFSLILKDDGNLAIFAGPDPPADGVPPFWPSTPLVPQGKHASKAIMRTDGDFVVLDTNDQVLWETHTTGPSQIIRNLAR